MTYTRFAIYFIPPEGALADFGARWLGWDVARGAAVTQPGQTGLETVTAAPRKYGFHGTLKPPFRLVEGVHIETLDKAVAKLASQTAPARSAGLQLAVLGRFLALVPTGDRTQIARVAAACVTELDAFRATPTDAELARRRAANLTPAQDDLLLKWGYPYVLDEFRFHLTLTSALPDDQIAHWSDAAAQLLPALPASFDLAEIALTAERQTGGFELIRRYALTG